VRDKQAERAVQLAAAAAALRDSAGVPPHRRGYQAVRRQARPVH
jgi:hypothetical protein